MPPSFPTDEFRAFGLATKPFFPAILSDEDMSDPHHRRTHFDWAWQAVRYRYRSAAESNDEFKALLANASEMWRAGWGDEELNYKLERCIYTFFMAGLSVLESFGYCLYFLGGALRPADFPHIAAPRRISLAITSNAFSTVFPAAAITAVLARLLRQPEFTEVQEFRNLLAHRISGRRSIRGRSDGITSTHEETWHIPGSSDNLDFSADMLQDRLKEIDGVLATLIAAAKEFAESQAPQSVPG